MDRELSLYKIEELFARTPEPYRKNAIKIGASIIEDNSLDENQKEVSIKQLIFKVASISSKIAVIQKNLGVIWTEKIEASQQKEIANFLSEAENRMDEIVTNLDVEKADELLKETELRKEYILKMTSKKQGRRKTDKKEEPTQGKRQLKAPTAKNRARKFVQSGKLKNLLKRLGITTLAGLMTVYIGTGIVHGIQYKDEFGQLRESYTTEENLINSMDKFELSDTYKILLNEGLAPTENLDEYLLYVDDLAKLMNQYEESLKGNNGKIIKAKQERLEYHKSAQQILEREEEIRIYLQNLIKAKLVNAINTAYRDKNEKIHTTIDDVELGYHYENEVDTINDSYLYIKYETNKWKEYTNRESTFSLGNHLEGTSGRMDGELGEIVEAYRKLSRTDLSEDELLNLYKTVTVFVSDRKLIVNPETGKIKIGEVKNKNTDTAQEYFENSTNQSKNPDQGKISEGPIEAQKMSRIVGDDEGR